MSIRRKDIRAVYQALEKLHGIANSLIWRVESILGATNATGPVYVVLVQILGTVTHTPVIVQLNAFGAVVSSTIVSASASTTLATALGNMATVLATTSPLASQPVEWNDSGF